MLQLEHFSMIDLQVQAISQASAGLLQNLLELDGKQDAGSF